jgi:hypothetical protein
MATGRNLGLIAMIASARTATTAAEANRPAEADVVGPTAAGDDADRRHQHAGGGRVRTVGAAHAHEFEHNYGVLPAG